MGCCLQGEEGSTSKQIDRHMKLDDDEEKKLHRILLLGPGDSGKTTILKQMKKINFGGIEEDDRRIYTPHIRQSIISNIRILLTQVNWTKNLDENNKMILLANDFLKNTQLFDDTTDEESITSEIIESMEIIWKYWQNNNLSIKPINNSSPYFFNKMKEIYSSSYIPSFEDFLRFRIRTPGFVSERFEIDVNKKQCNFEIIDVGGQRSERTKWFHLFEEKIECVLYIISIGDYDKYMWEDNTTKRLEESITLFKQIQSLGVFDDKDVIIFLNKHDLFKQKLEEGVPITDGFEKCDDFPSYFDPCNHIDVEQYLKNKFTSIHENYKNKYKNKKNFKTTRKIVFHLTNALQTDLVDRLFREIQTQLVTKNLIQMGTIQT